MVGKKGDDGEVGRAVGGRWKPALVAIGVIALVVLLLFSWNPLPSVTGRSLFTMLGWENGTFTMLRENDNDFVDTGSGIPTQAGSVVSAGVNVTEDSQLNALVVEAKKIEGPDSGGSPPPHSGKARDGTKGSWAGGSQTPLTGPLRPPLHQDCPELSPANKTLRIAMVLTARLPESKGAESKTRAAQQGPKPASLEDMYWQSFVNKARYCREHGYDFIWDSRTKLVPGNIRGGTGARNAKANLTLHWMKVAAAKAWLPRYDWILLVDVDTLIMDLDRKLESFLTCDAHMIACRDPYTVNTGVWFLHRAKSTLYFLDSMENTPPSTWTPPFYEQGAFYFLYRYPQDVVWVTETHYSNESSAGSGKNGTVLYLERRLVPFERIIRVMPQATFNAYPTLWCIRGERFQFHLKNFLVHFAAYKYCTGTYGVESISSASPAHLRQSATFALLTSWPRYYQTMLSHFNISKREEAFSYSVFQKKKMLDDNPAGVGLLLSRATGSWRAFR